MRIVTQKQAAEASEWLTERYLHRIIADGRLPHYRVGGKVLVDLDEIDEFVKAGRVESSRRDT